MRLHHKPFQDIKSGKKTIEARLHDEKRQQIKINDHIIFSNRTNSAEIIKSKVTRLSKFNSFKEMFSHFGTGPFGFSSNSIIDATSSMSQYYSKEEEQKYGVIGIHIELVSSPKIA